MWKCPKCNREFNNTNQNHSCGEKLANIDNYIAAQSDDVRLILIKIREIIRTAAPDSQERIAWQMPTFWQNENLIHFSAQKKHLGIHPGALERLPDDLLERLAEYKTSKGSIQFPYDRPIDYELIADITRWRVKMVRENN